MTDVLETPSRADRVEAIAALADELGRQPLQREIAERLGISRSYAASLVNDPDGSQDRERKKRYAGICESCGGPTSGSEGRAKAPRQCISCFLGDPDRPRPTPAPRRIWNERRCEDAIVAWIEEHRRIPRTIDLVLAEPGKRPCLQTIMRYCYRYEEQEVSWSGGRFTRTVLTRSLVDVLVDLVHRLPADAIIAGSRNATTRAALFAAVGIENLVRDHGEKIGTDDYGTLWRLEREGWPEPVVMVEVLNSTPEPDGTFKDYFLRVPPDIRTPRAAVAWTFGMTVDDYAPAVQT